ncbi:hypothetical protein ACFL1B_01830 [Nanoarchaeota archaeon]
MDLQQARKNCIDTAKKAVAASVNEDNFIIQAVANIEELEKACNALAHRIREWYALHLPEASVKLRDNEGFLRLILKQDKKAILKQLHVKDSMGANLKEKDLKPILEYTEGAKKLFEIKKDLEKYLETTMQGYCKNLLYLAGPAIGGKLLSEAGSLKHLATMPSTAIQLLGAEKALFRHLKTGAKPPRHGHIFAHPLIQATKDKERGKVARSLADKLALCVRADFFGENFIAEKLKKDLEVKFSGR